MRAPLVVAVVLCLAGSTPVSAQSPSDAADVRCLLVLQAIARDPKQQDQAARGLYFYLGKLAARGAQAKLEAVMVAEGSALNSQAKIQAELTRCGKELALQTNALRATNTRIAAKLGAAQPPAK
jgi:hypothetical protein